MSPVASRRPSTDVTWPAGRFIRRCHLPIQVSGQASSCTFSRTPPRSNTTASIAIPAPSSAVAQHSPGGTVMAGSSTRVSPPTQVAGIGGFPSRNHRYAQTGCTPFATAHTLTFTIAPVTLSGSTAESHHAARTAPGSRTTSSVIAAAAGRRSDDWGGPRRVAAGGRRFPELPNASGGALGNPRHLHEGGSYRPALRAAQRTLTARRRSGDGHRPPPLTRTAGSGPCRISERSSLPRERDPRLARSLGQLICATTLGRWQRHAEASNRQTQHDLTGS